MKILCLLSLFYINEPVINMRENPSHDTKVVSQANFTENVIVEKEAGDWSYIRTSENYGGWIPSSRLSKRDESYEISIKVSRPAAHLYTVKDTEWGPFKTIPYGTRLKALEINDARWIQVVLPDDKLCYIQRGDVAEEPKAQTKADLVAFSQKFLGLPYTWGGRSSFGYDCSGFVQMLYNQIGIDLPRDSKDQVQDTRFQTIAIDSLHPGDLIFFGKSAERIMHVGMYIGDGQFIHSSARENKPWLRISNLTDFEWSGHEEAYYPFRTARQLKNP